MKPRWMRYRSSKWFELMMLESAIKWWRGGGGPCPFCHLADMCALCVFGPEWHGCYIRFDDTYKTAGIRTFYDIYGCTWPQAYPEIARVVRKV